MKVELLADAVINAIQELSDARRKEAELLEAIENDIYYRLDGNPAVVARQDAERDLRTAIVALIDARVALALQERVGQ